MYDQVLKFGAYIVDALRTYTQPIMIYIPPYAELRGGAWVVVDPTINPTYMEMFADQYSRFVPSQEEMPIYICYCCSGWINNFFFLIPRKETVKFSFV